MEPEVMSAEETAAYLRVSKAEVLKLLDRGELPGTRIGSSRNWKIRRGLLEAWLDDKILRDTRERRKMYEDETV